jgi:hypothetical protein
MLAMVETTSPAGRSALSSRYGQGWAQLGVVEQVVPVEDGRPGNLTCLGLDVRVLHGCPVQVGQHGPAHVVRGAGEHTSSVSSSGVQSMPTPRLPWPARCGRRFDLLRRARRDRG